MLDLVNQMQKIIEQENGTLFGGYASVNVFTTTTTEIAMSQPTKNTKQAGDSQACINSSCDTSMNSGTCSNQTSCNFSTNSGEGDKLCSNAKLCDFSSKSLR